MGSVGFKKFSRLLKPSKEVTSHGDIGLRVAYVGLKASYIHQEEASGIRRKARSRCVLQGPGASGVAIMIPTGIIFVAVH